MNSPIEQVNLNYANRSLVDLTDGTPLEAAPLRHSALLVLASREASRTGRTRTRDAGLFGRMYFCSQSKAG